MIDLHCHLLPNIDDGPKSWVLENEIGDQIVDTSIKNTYKVIGCNVPTQE
ncbi:MAG: hypothetical protein V3T32_01295 [Thermodesulfobacteriota bacterium]